MTWVDELPTTTDPDVLRRRIAELEHARDSQAKEIFKLRARGVVMLKLDDDHTVYGTSKAISELRRRLEG